MPDPVVSKVPTNELNIAPAGAVATEKTVWAEMSTSLASSAAATVTTAEAPTILEGWLKEEAEPLTKVTLVARKVGQRRADERVAVRSLTIIDSLATTSSNTGRLVATQPPNFAKVLRWLPCAEEEIQGFLHGMVPFLC